MKNTKFRLGACLLFASMTFQSYGQKRIRITPEITNQFIQAHGAESSIEVYRVSYKEIEYQAYGTAQVMTNEYKWALKKLEDYKPDYDLYISEMQLNLDKQQAVKQITLNIDKFLESDENKEIKQQYLIDAQNLADKYKIKVKTYQADRSIGGFLKTPRYYNTNNNPEPRTIVIYDVENKTGKNDLKIYQTEIQKLQFNEPEKTYGYREYVQRLDAIKNIQQTETGQVLSDKMSKRMAYMIDSNPIDVSQLSGDFDKLEDGYKLVLSDIEGLYVKNELINTQPISRTANVTERHPVLEKVGANEFYYFMSDNFINQIEHDTEIKQYENTGNTVEYKNWKTKYLTLIQSAQLNVNVCKAIISKHTYLNRFGEKLYDSSTFTKQEKITFNKNLDLLEIKNGQIEELEKNRDLYLYFSDKATTEELAKSYHLSDFYNSTNRCY